jgi:hypothetical protein
MTVGFNEPLHFEHNFACWPYTLTHTTVCFLKNVARWVDVYMSTSAGKLLQFSYSYVPGCLSPSEMTVGFNEPLHFEHNFARWSYTLTHTTVCFLKSVARWVDVYMSTSAGKLLQFSYSYVPGCPESLLWTVGHYETNVRGYEMSLLRPGSRFQNLSCSKWSVKGQTENSHKKSYCYISTLDPLK